MRIRPRHLTLVLGALLLVAGLTGCRKKGVTPPPVPRSPSTTPTTTTTPSTPETPPTPPAPATPSAAELNAEALRNMQVVYFEYDSFTLSDASRAALDANAKLLRSTSTLTVSLDGHCDERGTVEYNQALGQKRAEAVQQYLVDTGVSADRLRVISYGKERPAVEGHDEGTWSKNRRVEFTAR